MRWTAPRKQEVAHLIRHGSAVPPSPMRGRPLVRCTPKAPLSGADSPYQGEMSRRDKRGRDAVSRRLTERFYQICRNLSVSAHAEPPPLEGEAFFHGDFPFRRQILSACRQNSGISRWVVDGLCAIVTCRWEKGKDFGKFIFAGKNASPSRGGGSA